jgi:DNA-binding transcriptional LysR family regulator
VLSHLIPDALVSAQVRPYQEDEVVLIVGDKHPLAGETEIDKEAFADLKFVSLHRSSTVKGIRTTLEKHGINWTHLQVVLVRLPSQKARSAAEQG